MGIAYFFDKTTIISRLKSTVGSRTSYNTTATVEAAIQELDKQSRVELDLTQDRAWQAYFPIEADVQMDDLCQRIDTGQTFKVTEVTKKDYGINQHLDVILIDYVDN